MQALKSYLHNYFWILWTTGNSYSKAHTVLVCLLMVTVRSFEVSEGFLALSFFQVQTATALHLNRQTKTSLHQMKKRTPSDSLPFNLRYQQLYIRVLRWRYINTSKLLQSNLCRVSRNMCPSLLIVRSFTNSIPFRFVSFLCRSYFLFLRWLYVMVQW